MPRLPYSWRLPSYMPPAPPLVFAPHAIYFMLTSSLVKVLDFNHLIRHVGSSGNIGFAALASGLQAACSPRTFCSKCESRHSFQQYNNSKRVPLGTAESPPFGIAVLLAAFAAGSPPSGTSRTPLRCASFLPSSPRLRLRGKATPSSITG